VADQTKLRQTVLNLVGNAVKFTSHGRVTLRLASRPTGDAKRVMLVIEVKDSGAGIAPEDQPRVFEPFVQLAHKSDQKGTGLGLTITRQFVELMGGTIRLESELGKGSAFRVELPVQTTEAAVAATAEVPGTNVARLAPGQPGYRVLIVEDQEVNWQLLRQLLEHAGFEVRVAENGAKGVAEFESWRPHFIWMDWRMPVMDGLEATRRIRTLDGGRDVKIVALSASVFREERQQVLAAGADDFAAKPFQFGVIYDCMARLLGVRFVADMAPAPVATAPLPPLDRKALEALPAVLRANLAETLVSLDPVQIAGLICRVTELDPALGGTLERHVDQFHYTAIRQALQACALASEQGPAA
jgi:CheY-like chemotaxis protein